MYILYVLTNVTGKLCLPNTTVYLNQRKWLESKLSVTLNRRKRLVSKLAVL